MKAVIAAVALALFAASCAQLPQGAAPAAAVRAAEGRWQAELRAFAEADRAHPPAPGGVLFVGSSTIRMWTTLAQDFPQAPTIVNRGFGGSTMLDCSLLVDPLVLRLAPRHVLVYAGDNDLSEGRTPQQVLQDFMRFVAMVHAALPDARIAFISIKPSPSREALLPKVREANAAVAAWLKAVPRSDYVDVFTPMMGADGRPRAELFVADRLHLSHAGYRLWQSVVGPYLSAAPGLQ